MRAENERESVANIYKEEYDKLVLQFNDVKLVAEHLPQFVTLQPSLYKKKAQNYPNIPRDASNISFNEENMMKYKFTYEIINI